jgi:hypothetical protein
VTLAQVLTFMFATGNALGMIMNVKKIPAGWYVVAFAQFSMGAYLIITNQWKQGLPQFVCLGIALWGSYVWTKQRREVNAMRDREL